MLRYGTVGVLEGGDDEQAAKSSRFMEADIDQILENSSRVVRNPTPKHWWRPPASAAVPIAAR